MPSWCLEILKDVLDKKQLIVVLDDGRPEFRQSAVVPNALLVKRVKSKSLKPPSQLSLEPVLKISVTEVSSTANTYEPRHVISNNVAF